MTKTPPLSLRVPETTRLAVEKLATARGIPRNAAYVDLIQQGLKLAGAKSLANIAKADAPALRAAIQAGDAVPLYQPKAFNPQPKRGTKK